MQKQITYKKASQEDLLKLSVLYKQVYIQTYGVEGVSAEFANFITRQFSTERLEAAIKADPEKIIVAAYKNNLVGVAEIDFDKRCPVQNIAAPEVSKLYILEWFCGMGIGARLIAEAENVVRGRGINEMWVWVLESNTRAIGFYEKAGYKWIGDADFQMEENCYRNKVMVKTLSG